jgi:hypothetical protein
MLLGVPFALYEYDAAFNEFLGETARTLAEASSPILSQMQSVETSGTVGSRVRDRGGMDVDLEPVEMVTKVTSDFSAVRNGDYEQLYAELAAMAESMAKQMVGAFLKSMNKVTTGTGNVVDAGGKPFSYDVLYELFEKMEFSVDENDELVMPSMVMHPDQAEKLKDLPPPTPEQQLKLEELKERKREEALARRRRRRLS